ncbi:MAG: glyoxalase [Verrucomicrobiota bacterium]
MTIYGLDHVQLAMPPGCEDQARAFFGGVLGMTEEAKPEPLASRGGCWFRQGAAILHLGVEADFRAQKKAHPAFLVGDLDELGKKLGEVKWDDALPDRRRFYASDPFGNRLEFVQRGDGFSEK